MRHWLLVVAGVLLASSCGSGGDGEVSVDSDMQDPAESTDVSRAAEATEAAESVPLDDAPALNAAPLTVESDDGMLTLEIPAGAMPGATDIQVTARAPAADVEGDVVGRVYELQPDGLVFAQPVDLTVTIPARPEWGNSLPWLAGVLESGDMIELDVGGSSTRDGDTVRYRTTIDHFSHWRMLVATATLSLDPESVTLAPGESFGVTAKIAWDAKSAGEMEHLGYNVDFTWSATGDVERTGVQQDPEDPYWRTRPGAIATSIQRFVCNEEQGSYTVAIKVGEDVWDSGGDDLLKVFGIRDAVMLNGAPEMIMSGDAFCWDVSTDSIDRIDPPSDINPPYTVEATGDDRCGWPPPLAAPNGALMQGHFQRDGDDKYQRSPGYSLMLGLPHGAFVQYDADGNLVAKIEPRGDEPLPEWELVEVRATEDSITIVVDETRYDDNGQPCTQRMTYVYTFPTGIAEILTYMKSVPAGATTEVEFNGATASFEDDVLEVSGQVITDGLVWIDVWLECSGEDLQYRLAALDYDSDGNFLVTETIDGCVVVNIAIVVDGDVVTRASVS